MASFPALLAALSSVYGGVARQRRAWYERPDRQRHLRQPVISVGNLSVGGSGKTPIVAHLARLLLANGERPAILSRGYRRRVAGAGVTVVADPAGVRSDLDHAGDEPLMLARELPGVSVVVARERYLAGRHAESELGATVHLLDDGFQHVQLARDVNLLVVSSDDLTDRVLPAGRLREPLTAASAADAVLVSTVAAAEDPGVTLATLTAIEDQWPGQFAPDVMFTVSRSLQPVRVWPSGAVITPSAAGPVLAVAGIARPERLFGDLAAAGWRVSRTLVFPDHHRYQRSDVARMLAAASDGHAGLIVTTAKDAVRLEALDTRALTLAVAPTVSVIEPAGQFDTWLMARLARARRRQSSAAASDSDTMAP